ncbi:MAG TPA: pyridoxal 5'-phosphate synthase glutaminase subunit PdxT, partial [bacterium]|nr:pyridoxal 5'-phosphate synthase glutaminase subunit PdxT [bacterium]
MDRGIIGVLALQGAFAEHISILHKLDVSAREVRTVNDLDGLDGLIIPGGESTVIGKMAVSYRLFDALRTLGQTGFPIWGTCAGLIFLAKDVGRAQPVLGLMDITV